MCWNFCTVLYKFREIFLWLQNVTNMISLHFGLKNWDHFRKCVIPPKPLTLRYIEIMWMWPRADLVYLPKNFEFFVRSLDVWGFGSLWHEASQQRFYSLLQCKHSTFMCVTLKQSGMARNIFYLYKLDLWCHISWFRTINRCTDCCKPKVFG